VLERYHRELLNFLTRQVNDRDTAADLAQESFVRVLTAQSSGQAVLDMRALLYSTARNLVIDQHRRGVHRRHDDIDALDELEQPQLPHHQQPEEILSYEQQARALVDAIEALPPRCREAFVLNRFEGLSHQEVAERMGISKNMVAQHVARGLLSCRDCLERLAHGPTSPAPPQEAPPE
jgi:RNA polymerase sigma-70 factor (ECF subfamily)